MIRLKNTLSHRPKEIDFGVSLSNKFKELDRIRSRETNVHLFLVFAKSFFLFLSAFSSFSKPKTDHQHLAFPFISLPSNNMPSFRLYPLPTSLSLILQWAPNVSPFPITSKPFVHLSHKILKKESLLGRFMLNRKKRGHIYRQIKLMNSPCMLFGRCHKAMEQGMHFLYP